MSSASFTYGMSGTRIVLVQTYDEAEDVVSYLLENGMKLVGYTMQGLCSVIVPQFAAYARHNAS